MNDITCISDLTKIEKKADLYRRETYFRESVADAREVFGEEFPDVVRNSALLMMKPDGLAAEKLSAVHAFLEENGFDVVGVEPVRLERLVWRELWRYQLTSATLDRLAVNEHLFTCGEALVLLLRSDPGHPEPATVRLSGLKGSATLAAQRPGTLRSRLGQPNRVLSFLHVADEPADLLRELGVLLGREDRLRAMRSLRRGALDEPGGRLLEEALRGAPRGRVELVVADALARVEEAVEACGARTESAEDFEQLRRSVRIMREGGRIDFRRLSDVLRRHEVKVDPWDLAVVATSFIDYDDPGEPKVIENPPPGAWAGRRAGGPSGEGDLHRHR
ncbi:nucleoside-diphosphate kinase [Nocardiopsis sp. NPDC101807]|uniref:nucleoside-diphosphate kinase n=1 Tax=Nocardiopsis sp. NPDC101807 TaxID=3364339 RepID=UPI00380BEB4E